VTLRTFPFMNFCQKSSGEGLAEPGERSSHELEAKHGEEELDFGGEQRIQALCEYGGPRGRDDEGRLNRETQGFF